jgi:hypothetical protein
MQIVTRTQLLLSINTQIFDNCANKQKDNNMNKDDNKNKTKTPFSENSFHEIAKKKKFYELKKNKITTF